MNATQVVINQSTPFVDRNLYTVRSALREDAIGAGDAAGSGSRRWACQQRSAQQVDVSLLLEVDGCFSSRAM
jgi:hypothetical protein